MSLASNISIILCPRDRAQGLQRTVETINEAQIAQVLKAELVIVDNGSMGTTRAIVQGMRLPNMETGYLLEGRKGKSYALNSALARARCHKTDGLDRGRTRTWNNLHARQQA